MGMLEFLSAILPTQGHYVLAVVHPTKGKMRHETFDSVEAMAKRAQQFDTKGWSVYHACCTVDDPQGVWVEKNGRRYRSVRTTKNTAFIRSQWLDVDVGEGKDFPTRKAALKALKAMCKHFKIPAPTIVLSGHGLHCYWTFSADLEAPLFKHRARHFSEAIKAWGFPHDTKPTRNVVTLLRPVGTHHRKGDPILVKIGYEATKTALDIDEFYNSFGQLGPDNVSLSATGGWADAEAAMLNEWGTGAPAFAPSDAKLVAKQCAALRDFALRKHDSPPIVEDHWRNMLGLLKHCEGGEALAHKWSKQSDKRYSHGETEEKIQGWAGGPPMCATISANCDLCKACPHLEKGRSPVSYGKSAELPPVQKDVPKATKKVPPQEIDKYHSIVPTTKNNPLPFWPKKYHWDGSYLRVWVKGSEDTGEWVPFSGTLYYPYMRYQKADGTRAVLVCVLINPQINQWKLFELDTSKISDHRSLAIELAAHEVIYMKGQQPLNQQFVQDILHGIRDCGLESKTYSSFGWHDEGFVLGDKMITADGPKPVFLSKRIPTALREGFGTKGTFSQWAEYVDLVYNRDGAEAQQVVICAMASAILTPLCDSDLYKGQPIASVGEPGTGKSATAQVGASIFGNPALFTISANGEGTTMNALISRIATHRNLPIIMDEITGRTAAEMSALVFALSSGRPKARLKSDGTEVDFNEQWATNSVITGNTNMLGMMSEADRNRASASQVRVLQIQHTRGSVAKVFSGINGKRDIEKNILNDNYGVVGERLIQVVVKNKEKITKRLQHRLQKNAEISDDPAERFHYALAAVVMEGAALLKDMGAIKWDIFKMERWMLRHIVDNRAERTRVQMTAEDYLQEFISWLTHRTIITLHYDADSRKVSEEYVDEPRFDPMARHATADKHFIVLRTALTTWCREHPQRIDPDWLLEQFEVGGFIKSAKESPRHRITKGTELKGTRARCVEFVYEKLGDIELPIAAQTA